MRINIAALALASSLNTGMATPALDRRNYTGNMSCMRAISLPIGLKLTFRGQPNVFLVPEKSGLAIEQAPPTCNAVACIGLTGTLTCVLSAISGGDTAALQHCLSGGLGEV